MKKILKISVVLFVLSLPVTLHAQENKKATKKVEKAAEDVGDKTAETASKAKSTVTDQKYKDKVGPDGQTIYIDKHSKYYWVDDKGHKQYVDAAMLKDKPKKD